MAIEQDARGNRRAVIIGGAAIAAGVLVGAGRSAAAGPARQRLAVGGGGLSGGGTVAGQAGEAEFSVFASRLTLSEKEERVIGQLRWGEGETTLESIEVSDYGPLEGDKRARRLVGTLSVNGEGSFPFILTAVDGGTPGSGLDTVTLTVGDADAATPSAATTDAFSYAVTDAPLTGGDLQLLDLTTLLGN